MIYIIFLITSFINIFNIGIIGDNKLKQIRKEKLLLITYSVAELLFILYIFNSIEFISTNLILALSFIIIWLLSKSYICILNMNFENVDVKGWNEMEKFSDKDIIVNENKVDEADLINTEVNSGSILSEAIFNNDESEELFEEPTAENKEIIDNTISEETQIISEVDCGKLELNEIVQNKEISKENIITHNSLYDLADVIRNDELNKDEERKIRRRSLALKVSKIQGNIEG